MREYTLGKKGAMVVLHQMFSVLMVVGIFIIDYFISHNLTECINAAVGLTVIAFCGSFIMLAYLTNITGYKSEDDKTVYYLFIDKVYSDVLLIGFLLSVTGIFSIIGRVRKVDFEFSSLIVTVATLTYILDIVFLLFYHSIIRRMKGNIIITHSIIYKIYSFICEYQKNHKVFLTNKGKERYLITQAIEKIGSGALDTRLCEDDFHGQEKDIAKAINHIRDGLNEAVTESIKNEKMKADLITNVSHDIKTPLTSILNYVELLKRENLDNENAKKYIRLIDEKSQRLKHLAEDLVDLSKISSGNIKLDMNKIDWVELLYQTGGEFNERFEQRNLTIVTKLPSHSMNILADGRQLYRTIENLYTNAAKYAMENTRVYVDLTQDNNRAVFTIKNISKNEIKVEGGDYNNLTERFVRGEISRTTEGSGLGLSIAKNLTILMGGTFEIKVDGDLFIAQLSFEMI
ncbi:MAG: HAMP domain-containing sensor histidine kinase [Agathobacter sp.]|nr:HAMP domain-containing sensor histidine kinase [Agathobacter sp.]